MKKIYFLLFALLAFTFANNAQTELTDDIEGYSLGDISSQASHWRTWSGDEGGDEDADVSTDFAQSGTQSMHIGGNEITDELLIIESAPFFGLYTVQWSMYVPANAEAYFNAQGLVTTPQAQALFGGNVFFNRDSLDPGNGIIDGDDPDQTFSYPEDTWFTVTCVYDLDNKVWDMYIDGVQQIFDKGFAFNGAEPTNLGAIDFFSVSAANNYYVDDVVLNVGEVLSSDDFSANKYSVYPNPVQDNLNIRSTATVDSIIIYDVLGKVVAQEQPNKISPSIDMSNLSSGAYFVQVKIGDASNTTKVIK